MLSIASYLKPWVIPIGTLFFGPQITLETLNNTKVQEFIHSDGYQFDVVIFENFQHECFVTMGHKYGAHVIQLIPASPVAFLSQWHGQPFNPSYIPDPNSGFTDQMSIFVRITNTIVTCLQLILYPLFYMPQQNEIMLNHFNYTGWETRPPLEEMSKNISLTLINTHFTLGTPRPLVPNFIEVAGMHLKPSSKLPEVIFYYCNLFTNFNLLIFFNFIFLRIYKILWTTHQMVLFILVLVPLSKPLICQNIT